MSIVHIRNLSILTLDEQGTILHDADLVIRDGRIAHVAAAPQGAPQTRKDGLPADLHADEVVDGRGRVAMPGLVNTHSHGPMTLVRGWAEDLPFPRWLNDKIWVAESALTPEDVYWGAQLAACEMIRAGIVAFNDHYFYMDRVAEVAVQSGMKATLAWCVFGLGAEAEVGPGLDGTLAWALDTAGAGDGRVRVVLGPHSPYICPPAFLERVVELAHTHGLGIHLHLSESPEQVTRSLDAHGRRPVQHVDALGVLDVPGGCVAAHCLLLDEEDTAILADKGVHVSHCPITYMKLAMPFPTLEGRLAAGVRVCLGTDGPASNADMDMFAVMRQTALMEKHLTGDPARLPGDTVLRMATQHGARALGLLGTGTLTVGAAADLILVNLDAPHMRPQHDLVANLVHAAKAADVTDVMVDGRWLMRDRALLTLDEERVVHEADRRARDMVARGMQRVRDYHG